ncbi:MAG: peptidylprolyl isomerase [Longimicrobiales bacterium]
MRLRPEILLVTFFVSAAACAPTHVSTTPAVPVATLDAGDVTRVAALIEMQDRRVLDSALLRNALGDSNAVVREQAALAGGRIGDHAAVPALIDALGDTDARVAATAAFALGELADSSAAAVQALAAAVAPEGWARPEVAAEAAHALGMIGQGDGPTHLWAALTGDAPAPVLHGALLAIWRLPRTSDAVDAVAAHLDDANPETRWRAAYALMRMSAPAAVPTMIAALGDPDHRVRVNSARALNAADADSARQRPAARQALRGALADTHPHVVIQAARTLAGYHDAADVPALATLLETTDTNIAIAAAGALGELGSAAAGAALRSTIDNAAQPLSLRAAALASLTQAAPHAALPVIDEWSGSDEWLVRFYAARALAGAEWPAPEAVLERLARDTDPRVTAEALASAATLPDSASAPYRWFVEGLAASDVMVRAAAARGIARAPRPMDLPLLLQAYERATSDSLTDAAVATAEALGALQDAGVPVERSFFVRFPRAQSDIVRRAVNTHIGSDWGALTPVETGRTAAEYEAVVRSLIVPALAGTQPRVRIVTERGDIVLELAAEQAPLTVANFLGLITSGYYASAPLRWHRVVPNFVLQDGDVRGDGSGGPAHSIRDEINRLRYDRGMLGMALAGPDTGGSQFFITHSPQPHLDGGYTIFGRVVGGMDIADSIVQDDAILAIEVMH